jgi:hypothetical protein
MNITEVISLSSNSSQILDGIARAFSKPIFDESTYVISKSGNHLASREHVSETNPIYIHANYRLPTEFFSWISSQHIDLLSCRLYRLVSPIATQIVGKEHSVFLSKLPNYVDAEIDAKNNEILLNEDLLSSWLDTFYDVLIYELEHYNIIKNNTIIDFDKFVNYLKNNTFLSVSNTSTECMKFLNRAIRTMTTALVHELVHAAQHTKQPDPTKPAYKTYMNKTPLSQLTADDNYAEYYYSSPQEIAAKAHDTVANIIEESRRKDPAQYLQQMVDEVKYIINRPQSSGYPIVDYYAETFKRGTKYYFVYKRFIKLVYLEVVRYIEAQMKIHEIISETATAGATSSANIGTVVNPHISPGSARGKKSYTGTPGKSGTKAPPQLTIVQPKTSNGTAKNALDIKGTSVFGGSTLKR